jgi:hypothetical protein
MTIKQFSFLFLLCLISVSGRGQIAFQKYFLSSPTDVRAQIFETSDSNLIIARQTIIDGVGHIQMIKADQNGDTLWCKTVYDTLIKHYFSSSQSADGNFFIGGVNADSITNMRGAIVKIDTSGNVLWSKVFSDTIVNCITLIQQLKYGDLLIGGMLKDHPYRFNTEGILMRCDSTGNIIWYSHNWNYPYPQNVIENNTGGFFIRGQYYFNYPAFYIARYDSSGNQLWQRPQYGLKNNSPFYYDYDSTIVSVGPENLLRFDSSGVNAGTINYTFGDETVSILRTNDAGYLIASVVNTSFTESKAVFSKVDSLLQPQWQKTIDNYSMESPTTCFQSRSGRYFFMGNIDSYQHQVRGFSLTGLDTTVIINSTISYENDLKHCNNFYPNPFQNTTQMDLPEELMNAEVIVTDIFGRHKKTLHASGNKIILEKREMPTGIYFYQIISKGKILCSGKVVVGN